MRKAGFTLIESMVTLAVLGGLVLMVFAVFTMGSSGFKVGLGRLDLQSDLRRILGPLRRDIRNSSFQSASILVNPVSVPERPPAATPTVSAERDGLCMNGLLNLESDSSYASGSGLPIWDCYICYFATLDKPDGKLIRMLLKDPDHDEQNIPRNLVSADLSLSNPDLLQNNVKMLSDQVMEFGVELDQSNQLVNLHLRLRSKAGRQMAGGRSLVEILEVRTTVFPTNTNPRL